MRYFWVRSMYWREFLLPYVFLSCPLHRSLTTTGFPFVRLAGGYTCYRDSANNPKCSLDSTYTITSTSTIRTSTSTSPLPTNTPKGDDSGDDGLPDDGSNSDSDSSNDSNSDSSNGSNSTSSSSTSSSPRPSSSGVTSSNLNGNGVADWKGPSSYVTLAPFLVLIGMCL